ncbi:MAG: tail fiber domain-containing protein [Acidobacteriota bacterium]
MPRPSLAALSLVILLSATTVNGQPPAVVTAKSHTLIGDQVWWPVQEERTLLRISNPSGLSISRTFEAGERPSVSLAELAHRNGVLEPGAYKYSLVNLEVDDAPATLLPNAPRRHRALFGAVHWGTSPSDERAAPRARRTTDDWHVRTSAALSDQSASPFLHLEDTTPEGSGTETDWVLQTDFGLAGDGDSDFAIYSFDQDSGSSDNLLIPFVIENDAPNNSLYVEASTGQVGLGTNDPQSALHIVSQTPGIQLDDTFDFPYSWRLGGDDFTFDIVDRTANKLPFRIRANTPTHTLVLAPNGVGLGTTSPQGNLHIFGEENADVFSGVGPDLVSGPAFNFGYSGSSFGVGSGFFNVRPTSGAVAPNPALYFATRNVERMVIDRSGQIAIDMDQSFGNTFDPEHPLHAQLSGAHLSSGGVWTNASSRALKENVRSLSLTAALRALSALEPVTYNYRALPGDPQVGFIAEDVPELVATPDRRTLAHGEIVGVLTRVVQELQRQLEAQTAELVVERSARRELLRRIERLENGGELP